MDDNTSTPVTPHIKSACLWEGNLGDIYPPGGGSQQAKDVTDALESAGIPCCLVGVAALRYFGAGRISEAKQLSAASSVIQSQSTHDLCAPRVPYPERLFHTFPLFKLKGSPAWILLVPSSDCHFECTPSNFERSHKGLPYARLDIFAQSLLDTHDLIDLVDLVDGMDLSLEWGIENLQLDGSVDVAWAERKNEAIRASVPLTDSSFLLEVNTAPWGRREIWESIVGGKQSRIGPEISKEFWATRFRPKGDQDPRLPREKGAFESLEEFKYSGDPNNYDVVVVDWDQVAET
ncbi:hypothetical protein LOCC1_G006702 [Lachnellula occidentalis]|uniref:Uncharacterized protein n=1 Tax=Lachnellula occidentalis TaxID=215460 RepID=A0A8H8RP31_9HELO|nr:hypothetical protein LOCC1_G006702 [Lachnellula occidentalis]